MSHISSVEKFFAKFNRFSIEIGRERLMPLKETAP